MRETKDRGCRLALLLAATLVSGLAARAFAGMIEGDGKGKAANNCLVELSVQVSPLPAGPKMTCDDCDAGCDLDQTPDGVCTLQVALCVNQTNDSGCTPVELKKAIGKVMGVKGLKMLPAPSSLAGDPSCGAFASNFQLKLGGKKKNRPKTAVVVLTGISTGKRRARRVDTDHFVLTCKPHPAGTDCPLPPTVTTTTIPVVCGDGTREGDEECDDGNLVDGDGCDSNCTRTRCGNGIKTGTEACDPPCGSGCPQGQVCTNSCTCETTPACACGTPDPPAMLQFTSKIGSGTCGMMKDDGGNVLPDVCAGGSFAGQPCTTTSDCTGGICSTGTFVCGGLYFGGGGVSVPLPSVVPDMSTAMSKVTSCTNTCLALGGSTAAEAGGNTCSGGANHHNACTTNTDCPGGKCNLLHCTSANCLFGPPLPVTNPPQAQLSTCIVNRIARDATGTASCGTGETSALSVPLNSDIY